MVDRVVGHRLPAVRAGGCREDQLRILLVLGGGVRYRPAGLLVDALGPVDERVRIGGDELSARPIKHVVEAVLRGLHEDLARALPEVELGEDHLLRAVVVPAIARCRLVVPRELAALSVDRDDRRCVQVVAALAAIFLDVVRRAVAGADVDELEFGVVVDAVPHRRAAARFPAMARIPGGESLHEVRLVLRSFLRVARHGVEAPAERAGAQFKRRDITTYAREVGAGAADDDLVAGNDRGRRGRVRMLGATLGQRVDLVDALARRRIDRV